MQYINLLAPGLLSFIEKDSYIASMASHLTFEQFMDLSLSKNIINPWNFSNTCMYLKTHRRK